MSDKLDFYAALRAAGARGFRVRALGEIAIRCQDLETMAAFYRDVMGLEILQGAHGDDIVFFKLGESYGGHEAVLALFGPEANGAKRATGAATALHHLALTVDKNEQQAAIDWFGKLGLRHREEIFDWIGWRGVFVEDPEGNTVELVAKIAPGANAGD